MQVPLNYICVANERQTCRFIISVRMAALAPFATNLRHRLLLDLTWDASKCSYTPPYLQKTLNLQSLWQQADSSVLSICITSLWNPLKTCSHSPMLNNATLVILWFLSNWITKLYTGILTMITNTNNQSTFTLPGEAAQLKGAIEK